MERELNITSNEDARAKGWNIIVPFPGELIGKAVFVGEEGRKEITRPIPIKIMKSTKRIRVDGGCIYNTTTEYHKGDVVSVAEALVFVPEKIAR